MLDIEAVEREIELSDRVLCASEDWAKGYKKDKQTFAALIKLEAKFERIMRKYFREIATTRLDKYINWQLYNTGQLKAYKFNVIVDIEEIEDVEGGELLSVMHDPVLQSMALGAGYAEKTYNIELGLNAYNEKLIKAADKHVGKLIKGVTSTTVSRVQQSISTSISLGEDIETAKSRLMKIIADPKRAELIARTETVRSYSMGVTTFGKEAGYTRKIWEISSDPCEVCQQNEGAEVDIDGTFPSGDTEAPAHPRCRCGVTLAPYTSNS